MKSILIATDHSDAANNALNYAANMANQVGAELILFHSYKMSIHASNSLVSTEGVSERYKQSERDLAELAQTTAQIFDIKVSWKIKEGDAVETLRQFMSENLVDLVIMGIESNLTEYKLFGNTTTEVIKLMAFPLLVVPNDISFEGVERIMYACETSYLKDNCELGFLKRLAFDLNARIDVFHVLTNSEDEASKQALEHKMNEIFHDLEHEFKYVHNPRVGEGIEAGLIEYPADLLVMIPHKIGFFESLTKGSQTNSMTVRTRVPLLVIPNEKAC